MSLVVLIRAVVSLLDGLVSFAKQDQILEAGRAIERAKNLQTALLECRRADAARSDADRRAAAGQLSDADKRFQRD